MSPDAAFTDLIHRVRAGDEVAAAELVRRFEPTIRRVVRYRLVDSRLRRELDSVDVCQSVLASFFARAALGQYDLDQPEQVAKLLTVMARNKLVGKARKRRPDELEAALGGASQVPELVAAEPSPSRQAAGRDLLEQMRNRLTEQERDLADRRARGCEWGEIAAELGGTPDAHRKALARAVERVARELGLDD
jgi:RNA polymerase sigma-70 factor (ECF subfamily)